MVLVSLPSDELPQPYWVALPANCKLVSPSSSLTYNRGRCSMQPCQTTAGTCSQSQSCCFNVHRTTTLPLACSSSSDFYVTVITSCRCQPCDKHQIIRGCVLSSFNKQPLMLASVLIDREVIAVTDNEGRFFIEISATRDKELSLVIQEAHHHQLELAIPLSFTFPGNVTVIMEYIAGFTDCSQLQLGFSQPLSLVDSTIQEAFQVVLAASANVFIYPHSQSLYTGAGQVLDTVYHGFPVFTSHALQQPVYHDSRGAEFAIFSLISGSVSVVSEQGTRLAMRKRSHLTVTITFKKALLNKQREVQDVEKLHLFSFSVEDQRWVDKGKVKVVHMDRNAPLTTIEARLRTLNSLWSIAVPVRVSCHVRVKATSPSSSSSSSQMLWLLISQSLNIMGLSSTHQQMVTVRPVSVACFQAVCSLGGRMQPNIQGLPFLLASPGVDYAILFVSGGRELLFYCNDKTYITSSGTTPYYPSLRECIASNPTSSGYFSLLATWPSFPSIRPALLSLPSASLSTGHFCYIKVAVLSCALLTGVTVISLSGEQSVHSNHQLVLNPSGRDQCREDAVMKQVATCLSYSCGTMLQVSAQQKRTRRKGLCRPWSIAPSLLSITRLVPLQSFLQLSDTASLHNTRKSGVYYSSSRQLAMMKCMSGCPHHPSLSLDATVGLAVTFVC